MEGFLVFLFILLCGAVGGWFGGMALAFAFGRKLDKKIKEWEEKYGGES
jgi:hypothetical protein